MESIYLFSGETSLNHLTLNKVTEGLWLGVRKRPNRTPCFFEVHFIASRLKATTESHDYFSWSCSRTEKGFPALSWRHRLFARRPMLLASPVWKPKDLLLFSCFKKYRYMYPRFSKVCIFTRMRLSTKLIVRLATMRTAGAMK